jgi:hypothetical protein
VNLIAWKEKAMSARDQTAFALGRRDEKPNTDLARKLVDKRNVKGIREIAAGLRDANPALAGDCVKVLYEIGERNPALIAPYAQEFLQLLRSRNNRLVWGGMSALAAVAGLAAEEIFGAVDVVLKAFHTGSVITVDRGVTVLARVCRAGRRYEKALWPVILEHLASCRPKDLPQHAQRALAAVQARNAGEFSAVLLKRISQLNAAQAKRIKKILEEAEKSGKTGRTG